MWHRNVTRPDDSFGRSYCFDSPLLVPFGWGICCDSFVSRENSETLMTCVHVARWRTKPIGCDGELLYSAILIIMIGRPAHSQSSGFPANSALSPSAKIPPVYGVRSVQRGRHQGSSYISKERGCLAGEKLQAKTRYWLRPPSQCTHTHHANANATTTPFWIATD